MKKALLKIFVCVIVICSSLCVFTACGESPISFKLNFIVDNEIVKTIDTTGNEKIALPNDPQKDGCTFDGWFWDKDVWEKPFTANSFLDAPLSSDMSVYAKFTKNHEHNYTATVTDDAVVGSAGNKNEFKIEYSNDPYTDGTGESTTIENKVYTFHLTINKVDDEGKPLEGAGFTLYKADGTPVGEEITGKTTFDWDKLDAGSYKVVETTVPSGYTKADDIEFTITAKANANDETITASAKGVSEFNDSTYVATINVKNNAGTTLPSTGGIGTTIFYILGAILVLGAGILLIARRRMQASK